MKKNYFLIFILLFFLISGCSNSISDEERDDNINTTFSGVVVKKEVGRVLVTNYIGNSENKSEAIWVKTTTELEIGDTISVKFDGGIETSNPAQGKAKKIDVIHDKEQNERFKKEAIVKAINESKYMDVPVIKTVEYNKKDNQWVIKLFDNKNGSEEKEINIELKNQ
ncbi:DUF3221 domain-containing protein [Paenibacillus tuaregi]|uniref:DUF3221 domain-containing protein n=1 Tax=Paenibacillus tuaregi TaxID=1816681 RepID=UPI000838993A|nr:DUF3221 domain-containing protein [Paenibacillus tuaregi]